MNNTIQYVPREESGCSSVQRSRKAILAKELILAPEIFYNMADQSKQFSESINIVSNLSRKHGSTSHDFTEVHSVKKSENKLNSTHSKNNSLIKSIKMGSKRRSSHQKSLKLGDLNGDLHPCQEFYTITSDHERRENVFANEIEDREVFSQGQDIMSPEELVRTTSPPKNGREKSSGSKQSKNSRTLKSNLMEKGMKLRQGYIHKLLKGSQTVRPKRHNHEQENEQPHHTDAKPEDNQ